MTEISLKSVTVIRDNRALLNGASVSFARGEVVALVGPNGAGKTTLLKCALGLITPDAGSVKIDGRDVSVLSPIDRALLVSYLPQIRPLAWPIRVRDVVALGRYAYGAAIGKLSSDDARAVERAITECNLEALAHRRTDTLSGGELARVHCARAFAANTPLLLADEPIAALDPNQQFKILTMIRRYVDKGGGALIVLHDIGLAARFADRLIWMKEGEIVAAGDVSSTFNNEMMSKVFDVETEIVTIDGVPTLATKAAH